jgi:hypothetical protein
MRRPTPFEWSWVILGGLPVVLLGAMSAHHYAADAAIRRARAGR